MEVLTTIEAVRAWRGAREAVGLVPTMGYLHDGHLSLVRWARAECDDVVASIFVNPTQFGPTEDLAAYPRDMERDLAMLEQEGCDLVFAPTAEEMYPPGFRTYVEVGSLADVLEGGARPGHMRGVATVVAKLFAIARPTRAYFGAKDAQQLVVVRRMARDLDTGVNVIGCPTVRAPDGLALSSRNTYLSPSERAAAPILYRALVAAREAHRAGETDAAGLRSAMERVLASEPLARVEYVSVAHPETLRELDAVGDDGALLSMAVRIGPARLIDNIVLPSRLPETAETAPHHTEGDTA